MVDIYSLDIINWIKDTSIYKWYSDLLYPRDTVSKDNRSNEFQFPKRITNKTTENETEHTRISEWINRNPKKEIEETKESSIIDTIQNNSKTIIIISGIIIVTGLSWYYFDEIKDVSGTTIEWIKNHFSRPSAGSGTNNPTSDITPSTQSNKENWQNKFWRIISKDNEITNQTSESSGSRITIIETERDKSGEIIKSQLVSADRSGVIELVDNTKGKGVLTSPSLEDLNNKAQESWENSSDSSSSTITPDNLKSSSSSSISPITQQAIREIWQSSLNTDTVEDINFIESTFNSEKSLSEEISTKLFKKLVDIFASYDDQVHTYKHADILKGTLDERNKFKVSLFEFRKWISKYHQLIIPTDELIEIGDINDEPELLIKTYLGK